MTEQQKQRVGQRTTANSEPIVFDDISNESLTDALDDVLDQIDSVLDQNAEEFVKNFVQKGGQ